MTTDYIPHIFGSDFITLMIGTRTHTIRKDSHPNYEEILQAVKTADWTTVQSLISVKEAVKNFSQGKIEISNGVLYYNGNEIHNSLVIRIQELIKGGFGADSLIAFLENLLLNPSKTSVDELYEFLEKSSLPITQDGCFLAYKKVRDDYKDFYTGNFDNSVGQVVSVLRNQVDDNRENTCSNGLHFCSLEYLPKYHGNQGRVMIVKVNPMDVVSFPKDYNISKGRTCEYTVVGEHVIEQAEITNAFTTHVYTDSAEPVASETKTSINESNALGYDIGFEETQLALQSVFDVPVVPMRLRNGRYASAEYKNAWKMGSKAAVGLYNQQQSLTTNNDSSNIGFNNGRDDYINHRPYGSTVASSNVDPTNYWTSYYKGWISARS